MNDFPGGLVGKSFENWQIERQLGEGASAVVFLATRGKTTAAIKIYRPELIRRLGERDQRERIERQLKYLPPLDHPSLVRILGGGYNARRELFYLLMEYVEGYSLDSIAKNVPVERIAPLLAQIASAAQYLEEHDMVHRDIKPANIIVDEQFRRAKLLDFGVIKPLAGFAVDLTDTTLHRGAFIGTLRYSPPEFLSREEEHTPDGWRAITFYQLGALANDLITGKPLFHHLSDAQWPALVKAVESEKPDLSTARIRDGVAPRLVTLAANCLEKKSEDRLVTWQDFQCRRFVRRPVIVLVYTGGTIGATVDAGERKTRVLRAIDNADHRLLKAFQERVLREYAQLSGPDAPLAFDLVWDFLPPEEQILSENAKCETWMGLGQVVERVCAQYAPPGPVNEDEPGVYLAGIILLHGTDTLSYSAASLALSLRNLPCPIVLTGSNQPPNENKISERDLFKSESDAWKNVMQSLQFIQTFGHRFTEVFVCFNDTVHVAVNLRKDPIDRTPQPFPHEQRVLQEPYFYRNRGPLRQYAYRIIDGLYCNNFYPISPDLDYDVLIGDPTNENRHIRPSPWSPELPVERAPFAPGVGLIPASPTPLLPGDLQIFDEEKAANCKVVLIEGYNSGTIPTAEGHPFSKLLSELIRRSIPVVLVTRNGMVPSSQQYEMSKIDHVELPILRMFGLVAETAVPLISLALARIPEEQWNLAQLTDPVDLLRHRHERLAEEIRTQTEAGGILSALLGDVLDQEAQRKALLDEIIRREREHMRRVTELFSESMKARLVPGRKKFDATKTVLQRQHFLWLLAELVNTFETSGSGADGLAFWNELGFNWAARVRDTLWRRTPADRHPLARRPQPPKLSVKRARVQTDVITQFLFNHGVAEVRARLQIHEATEAQGWHDGRFILTVNARKHGGGARRDNFLTAIGYRDDEAAFLRTLREGVDLTKYAGESRSQIERDFRELFEALDYRMSALDWFLLGTYKAEACGLLRNFRFDPWVIRCSRSEDSSHVEMLRRSIQTELVRADKDAFDFELRYAGRADTTRE